MSHTVQEWLREGTTVYALNLEGTNRFSALVQRGWATAGRLRTDDSELLANARLIAAAPDLLEALQNLYSAYCAEMSDRRDYPGDPWTPERDGGDQDALAAIAAIAKATGAAP